MIRVKLLTASRLAALALFITVGAALTLYLAQRNKRAGDEQGRPKLQGRVVAVFNNTHYAHEVNGKVRFTMTAGTDKTYEDGTHELEQVKLESFGTDQTRHDVVTSDSAKITDPSNLNKLDAEFISNVVVQTTDGLTVKTSYLHYDHVKNTIDTDKLVEFEGRNFAGRTIGMLIEATDERAHLHKDVEVKRRFHKRANAATRAPKRRPHARRESERASLRGGAQPGHWLKPQTNAPARRAAAGSRARPWLRQTSPLAFKASRRFLKREIIASPSTAASELRATPNRCAPIACWGTRRLKIISSA
jgi:LPS export ABC transporter protein LptC